GQQRRHVLPGKAARARELRGVVQADILALEGRVARRVPDDAVEGREVRPVVEGVLGAVREGRVGRVVRVEQRVHLLPRNGIHVVHAGLQDRDFPIRGLNYRLTKRQRHRNHPVGEVPLAVLNAGGDNGLVKATAVAHKLTLHHRLTLQWYSDLVEATGSFLSISHHIKESRRPEVYLDEQTGNECPSRGSGKLIEQSTAGGCCTDAW